MSINGVAASLENLSPNASYERRESLWSWGGNEALQWPSDDWRAPFTDHQNSFQEALIAHDLPSFARFDVGVANLLGVSATARWNVSNRELAVRRQDHRARIREIDVAASSVAVTVDGTGLDGAQLELAGDLPGERRVLRGSAPRTEVFETPGGLPPNAWLLIQTKGSWLDRRMSIQHASNDSFTDAEQAQIRLQLAGVKALLRAQHADQLSEEQLVSLEGDLDRAAETTAWLGRIDWRNIVVGAVFNRAFDGLINPHTARTVLELLGRALPHVLRLGQAALPF